MKKEEVKTHSASSIPSKVLSCSFPGVSRRAKLTRLWGKSRNGRRNQRNTGRALRSFVLLLVSLQLTILDIEKIVTIKLP